MFDLTINEFNTLNALAAGRSPARLSPKDVGVSLLFSSGRADEAARAAREPRAGRPRAQPQRRPRRARFPDDRRVRSSSRTAMAAHQVNEEELLTPLTRDSARAPQLHPARSADRLRGEHRHVCVRAAAVGPRGHRRLSARWTARCRRTRSTSRRSSRGLSAGSGSPARPPTPAGVNRMMDEAQQAMEGIGASVERHPGRDGYRRLP